MPDLSQTSFYQLEDIELRGPPGPKGDIGPQGPMGPSGSDIPPLESWIVSASDELTPLSTGTARMSLHAPYDFEIVEVFIGLAAASTSGPVTADVNCNGETIFSVRPTAPQGAGTSGEAFVAVLAITQLGKADKLTVDIDQAGANAKGLKVYIVGRRRPAGSGNNGSDGGGEAT
jgi:hypothetical protein